MKVLIFSHKSDIDGMGEVILSKVAFQEVDYELCELFNLNQIFSNYYDNGKFENYDKVFVTDLHLEKELLDKIEKDEVLRNKFKLFDHHETFEDMLKTYEFCVVQIKDEIGGCCGTSLFYKYLLDEGYLIESDSLNEFVEDVRQHDNWEWQKYNNLKVMELDALFHVLGPDNYIENMTKKLKNIIFVFDEIDRALIDAKQNSIKEHIEMYFKKILPVELLNHKGALLFIDYEYRNDIAEYIKKNTDYEFSMLVCLDKGQISFRSGKSNYKVREIAEYLGGGGHDFACAVHLSDEKIQELINILIKK